MRTGRLKFRAYTLLLAVLLLLAAILLAERLVQFHPVQQWLIERLSAAVGYEIRTGPVNLSFWRGIALDARDVTVTSPETSMRFKGAHVMFVLDPGALLKGRIVPTKFGASGVDLTISDIPPPGLDTSGVSFENLAASLDHLFLIPPVSLKKIKLNLNGREVFFENGYVETGFTGKDRDRCRFSAGGVVVFDEAGVPFSMSGEVARAAGETEDLFTMDLNLQISQLKAEWVPDFHGLSFTEGTINVRASGKGTVPGGFSFDTRVETSGLKGFFAGGKRLFLFDFPGLKALFEGEESEGLCDIRHINLSTAAWSLTGQAAFESGDGIPEAFSVSLDAPFMPYETFKSLVPTAYLPTWLNEKILDSMSGGQVRVDRFALQGIFDELKEFNLSIHPELLSLRLTWNGIKYDVGGAEVPFEDVSGRLDLADGNLSLSDLRGTFAASEVSGGGFEASPVWKPKRYLAAFEGVFKLGDLYRQQNMFFVPEQIRNATERFDSVQGTTTGAIEVEFTPMDKDFHLLKGAFNLVDCGFVHRDLPLPVQGMRADIVCEKNENLRVKASGFLGTSEMSIAGSLDGSEGFRAKVEGRADVNELINRSSKRMPPPVRFSRKVPFSGSVFVQKDHWNADGKLSLRDLGVRTEDVSMSFDGDGDTMSFKIGGVSGRSFQISSAEATLGGSNVKFAGSWDSSMPKKIDLRVSSESFNTSDAGVHVHGLGDRLSAILAGELVLGMASDAGVFALKGAVRGEIESSIHVFQGLPLSECRFSLGFDERSVAVKSFQGVAAGGAFNISGILTGWKGWRGNLSIHARDMMTPALVSTILKSGRNLSGGGISRVFQDADIGLSWLFERMTWNRMLVERIHVDSRLKKGILDLDNYIMLWDHGSMEGKGSVRMNPKPELSISGSIEMESQPLETLLYGFGSAEEQLHGDLTMEAVFSTRGATREELLKGLSGSVRLLVTEGVIKETRVLFQVIERLSLQQIFSGRPADVPEHGFYFERIEAEMPFSCGIAQVESAVMRSPVFNATGTGAMDLFNGRIEGDLHVQPLGSVDTLVSRIPLLGYILAGEESAVLIYRFKISGRISEPLVEYVPLRDLGGSVAGYIKRMLLTPGRIFRKFSDAVTGAENKK
jgi:hypothetical protein